jgi:VIT1/CCC1 family predicted Fe2+/Mn2+ transporter
MNRIEEYVERSFSGIPESEQKEQLKQEILQNLSDKVSDLIRQGKTQEDAENKAIVDFGDIDDLKQELKSGAAAADLPLKNPKYLYQLWFSVIGSILIIALVTFVDMYYTPSVPWFVYPTFAILWWPLSMFFRWLKHR